MVVVKANSPKAFHKKKRVGNPIAEMTTIKSRKHGIEFLPKNVRQTHREFAERSQESKVVISQIIELAQYFVWQSGTADEERKDFWIR